MIRLDDEYSFDYEIINETTAKSTGKLLQNINSTEKKILEAICDNPTITQPQIAQKIGLSVDGIRSSIKGLKKKGILSRIGSSRKGSWDVHLKKSEE